MLLAVDDPVRRHHLKCFICLSTRIHQGTLWLDVNWTYATVRYDQNCKLTLKSLLYLRHKLYSACRVKSHLRYFQLYQQNLFINCNNSVHDRCHKGECKKTVRFYENISRSSNTQRSSICFKGLSVISSDYQYSLVSRLPFSEILLQRFSRAHSTPTSSQRFLCRSPP